MSALYRLTIKTADKFVPSRLRPLWEHPAGPKTVFFWGPLFKWGLVIAGIGDLQRPAECLSVSQSGSLAFTGFILSRYCLVITPKNYSLCAVNVFVGFTQAYQLYRVMSHNQSQKALTKTMENGLVMAGIGDLQRPAESLSVSQSGSLAVTGLIWSRYCLVITPKNYSLCAVNVFVGLTQAYQLYRVVSYNQSQKALSKIMENKITN